MIKKDYAEMSDVRGGKRYKERRMGYKRLNMTISLCVTWAYFGMMPLYGVT